MRLDLSGEGALLPVQILAGQRRGQSPDELRFFLSHFLRRRTSLKRIGPETATSSCGAALHVNGIRSSATAAAASRHTMSITIGLASVAVAAQFAGRLSLSSLCFLCLTRITACWHAVRHCDGALWNSAPGKKRCLHSKTLTACRLLLQSVAGRAEWTALNWLFRFCAKRWLALLTGWRLVTSITKLGFCLA